MKIAQSIVSVLTLSMGALSFNAYADKDHDWHHDDDIEFEVISQGGQSGVDHQMTMVVTSQMHWEHLWKMHTSKQISPEPLPKVDFDTETVVAQFLGQIASCGYDIYTKEVEERKGYLKVESVVSLPAGDIQCLIAEQPYEFIKIPRAGEIIAFKTKVVEE